MPTFELCAGSLSDCIRGNALGADRIELNSALPLGGLTPSFALFEEARQSCEIPIICMVRPREGGFHYSEEEFSLMKQDAETFLRSGADGIAFGILNEDGTIDTARTSEMVDLIHFYGKEAIFHRAIDVTPDYEEALRTLIGIGADRILTSGQKAGAPEGADTIASVIKKYGDQIQILAGAGLNSTNVKAFIENTGVEQVHSSCKTFVADPTTLNGDVSFAAWPIPNLDCYVETDCDEIEDFARIVHSLDSSKAS